MSINLGNKDTSTTSSLNLLLSTTAEVASFDDEGLSRATSGQNFSKTSLKSIDNWDGRLVGLSLTSLFGNQTDELVKVDSRSPIGLASHVEVTHAELTKVAWMVTVHVDAVMVEATSKTTTTRMLTVLPNTTMTGGNVSTLLAILLIPRSLYNWTEARKAD